MPGTGRVRLTIDWTSEAHQHLLVVSLVVGRRALPIFWRAYDQTVLKGRMKRYELAVIKRAFTLIFPYSCAAARAADSGSWLCGYGLVRLCSIR